MITILTLLTVSILNIQLSFEQMLGKSKKEVQNIMNAHSEFNANNFGISTNDNTLRYYNPKKDVTLIFYFNQNQQCMHIKWMEDIESADKKALELNQKYTKKGKSWTTNTNNKNVIIELKKEEYNYSLNYHY